MLDRSVGGRLDRVIRAAVARTVDSIAVGNSLLAAGFPSPAYVWAVRSIEIFVKEVMLLPMFLERLDGDWDQARLEVRKAFGTRKFRPALGLIKDEYGPLDEMLTEDGKDVWSVWRDVILPTRDEVVHGQRDATVDEAQWVLAWADQMREQLTMRLIAAPSHPLHEIFGNAFAEAARRQRDGD